MRKKNKANAQQINWMQWMRCISVDYLLKICSRLSILMASNELLTQPCWLQMRLTQTTWIRISASFVKLTIIERYIVFYVRKWIQNDRNAQLRFSHFPAQNNIISFSCERARTNTKIIWPIFSLKNWSHFSHPFVGLRVSVVRCVRCLGKAATNAVILHLISSRAYLCASLRSICERLLSFCAYSSKAMQQQQRENKSLACSKWFFFDAEDSMVFHVFIYC